MDSQAPNDDKIALSAASPMRINSIPWWLWLIPIALLLVATGKMSYGYYTFTRIVVCGFVSFLAFVGYQRSEISQSWLVIFCAIAILFNPVIPIYLLRSTWQNFDIGVAIILSVHLVFLRLRWTRTEN